jgi:hypothetical protein
MGISVILSFILIGFNYQRLAMPEVLFASIISGLTTLGLIAYFSQIFWTFYFWDQFTMESKAASLLRICFFGFLLIITCYFTYRVLYLYFR